MSEQTGKTTASGTSDADYKKTNAHDALRAIAHEREEKARKLRMELSQSREATRTNVRQLLADYQANRRIGFRKQAAPTCVPEETSPKKSSLMGVKRFEGRGSSERATRTSGTTMEKITEEEQPKNGEKDLDSRILQAIISASSEGIAIGGIREQIDVPRKKLGSVLRKLVEDGKISRKKNGNKYFVNKPEKRKEKEVFTGRSS